MKASILILCSLLMSFTSSASIITASDNPGEAPGPVVYLGGFPTPHQDPLASTVPSSTTSVELGEDLRGAVSFDLQALDPFIDEGAGSFANGLFDLTFLWYLGGAEQDVSYASSSWADIVTWQGLGLGLVSFWTGESDNTSLVGDWSLFIYAEQTYVGGTTYSVTPSSVPEPNTILLFVIAAAGLFGSRLVKIAR